jgi:hypothetical protein
VLDVGVSMLISSRCFKLYILSIDPYNILSSWALPLHLCWSKSGKSNFPSSPIMATTTEAESPVDKHDSIYTMSSSPTKERCSEDLESGQPNGRDNIRSASLDGCLLTNRSAVPGRSRWQRLFGRAKPSEATAEPPDSVVRRGEQRYL